MVWTAWLLFSCKAEDLRIDIPKEGILALSQEDIRRDFWLAKQAVDDHAWYLTRMKQMGLAQFPTTEGICVGEEDWSRISLLDKGDTASQVGMAVQISLAKVQHKSDKKCSFCVYHTTAGDSDWILGDLRGSDIQIKGMQIQTKERMKDIDYPTLQEHVRFIVEKLSLI
jgi:hypothetical protein